MNQMNQMFLSKSQPIEYTNEKIHSEKPTVFSNLANISTAFADSLLLFLGLRPSENDDRSTPPTSSIMMRYGLSPQAMAYVQFKSTRLKGFNGVLTFFQQPNGSTVVYGKWNDLKDLDPMNYEFVIYKNGVMQRDITINIRRDIEIEGNSAFLLTTFGSLPLSGIDKIIGGHLHISNCGKVIAKSEICKI
ncbi:39692_t:CDS:1 [Gigaspora margarita]|uniref:39692_t:CDS:1 n=1 Tax=Gigaspora margarita TaxID=4874 RepID=A0ABN7UI75_GIGMA|nr:39692_t:CDS:1 [Gigaspora margarita]